MTIQVAVAELIGTLLETFSYGIYVVIFPKCLGILHKRGVNRGLMFYLLATMWISFVLITFHLVVDLVRAFKAFTGSMDLPGSPEEYYAVNLNTTLTVTKIALYVSATLLSDTLLVYRTYIVWGHKFWVIILPALLLGLNATMSAWFTLSIHKASPGNSMLVSVGLARSKYFYVVTLALNLLCTFLIGLRIWNINHKLRSHPAGLNFRERVLSAILESTAIYTVILVGLTGTSLTGNSAQFCFLNLIPPVVGSVFSYVIIRCSADNKPFHTGAMSSDIVHNQSGGVLVHLEQVIHHDTGPGARKSIKSSV